MATTVTPFATLTGNITSASQTSQVVLQIPAGELQSSQSPTVILGFAIAPVSGSSDSPEITKVTGPNGTITPVSIAPHGNTAADKLARDTHLFVKVIPLTSQSQNITLNVTTLNKKTGGYIVEAYLAGDVNGDGTVDATDLSLVNAAYATGEGQANYNPAADLNGDGRVGCIDRTLTTDNIGAHINTAVVGPSAVSTSAIVPLATASTQVSLVPSTAITPVVTPAAVATTPVAVASTPVAVTTPVAVATPVTTTTTSVSTPITTTAGLTSLGATSYVPVTYSSSSTIPVATTTATSPVATSSYVPVTYSSGTTVPVASTTSSTPILLTPVTLSNGTTGYEAVNGTGYSTTGSGYTAVNTGYTTASGTPVSGVNGYAAVNGTPGYVTGTTTPVYYVSQPTGTVATSATPAPIYVYGQPVVGGTTTGVASGTTVSPAAALFSGTTTGQVASSATPVPIYLYGTPTYSSTGYTPTVTTTPTAVATTL